jgi:hypothetical protein
MIVHLTPFLKVKTLDTELHSKIAPASGYPGDGEEAT